MQTSSSHASFSDIELDDADFATIDSASQPRVDIQLEASPVASSSRVKVEDVEGPINLKEKFKSGRPLTVSDLVSPDWCEYQYRYDMHSSRIQREKLDLDLEPFESQAGKIITANPQVVRAGRQVRKSGSVIHKVLELEVLDYKLVLKTTTSEDVAAVKLLNRLVGLRQLYAEGKTRELHLQGYIQGQLVTGIIDEIERRRLPVKPATSAKPLSSPSKSNIEFYFYRDPSASTPIKDHGYFLIDNKTRPKRSAALFKPSADVSTRGAQHQLALYHYCFNQHALDKFDWSRFHVEQQLSPDLVLSQSVRDELDDFVVENGIGHAGQLRTLNDLVRVVRAEHKRIGPLQQEMSLVYRLRDAKLEKAQEEAARPTSPAKVVPVEVADDSDLALQLALQESLKPVDDPLEHEAERPSTPDSLATPDLLEQLDEAFTTAPLGTAAARKQHPSDASLRPEGELGSIIGSRKFSYNEASLLAWFQDRMAFWLGQRQPTGVTVEETFKCKTCPYQEDCEWLEEKAGEIEAQKKADRLKEARRKRQLAQQRAMKAKKRAPPA